MYDCRFFYRFEVKINRTKVSFSELLATSTGHCHLWPWATSSMQVVSSEHASDTEFRCKVLIAGKETEAAGLGEREVDLDEISSSPAPSQEAVWTHEYQAGSWAG